jgi:hypothetical protein
LRLWLWGLSNSSANWNLSTLRPLHYGFEQRLPPTGVWAHLDPCTMGLSNGSSNWNLSHLDMIFILLCL